MSTAGVKLFQRIIVGVFDNQEQIEAERKKGQQMHPRARHVTDIIDHRIENMPQEFMGTFILEESYYTHPDGRREIKPLFFKISPWGELDITLESVSIPERYSLQDMVNSNPHLKFDYHELECKAAFGKAMYHNVGEGFVVNHSCDFGNGLSFSLIETLSYDQLSVMELLKQNDKQLTAYSEPIIYKRINE